MPASLSKLLANQSPFIINTFFPFHGEGLGSAPTPAPAGAECRSVEPAGATPTTLAVTWAPIDATRKMIGYIQTDGGAGMIFATPVYEGDNALMSHPRLIRV